MALSKEDWFIKLKSWVPRWMFENPQYQQAVFYALAKALSEAQTDAQKLLSETYITEADGGFLDLHGSERGIDRLPGENNASYATRIRNFTNKSNVIAIKELVDELLINGQCIVSEDFDSQLFFSRDVYSNRGQLIVENILNTFSIIVDNQTHSPFSFSDREYFMTRENFVGTPMSELSLFNAIIAAVNKAKALGTLYRVYERAGA